jgi:hypothetical protein
LPEEGAEVSPHRSTFASSAGVACDPCGTTSTKSMWNARLEAASGERGPSFATTSWIEWARRSPRKVMPV